MRAMDWTLQVEVLLSCSFEVTTDRFALIENEQRGGQAIRGMRKALTRLH
jgi:hypothetical protein